MKMNKKTKKRIKEQIIQKIRERRAKEKRERKKKFLYLRHTGQMSNYLAQKIPMMKREPIIEAIKHLKWWQRFYIVLILGVKRLWRKLFKKKNSAKKL